jgi:5-methylthioadenosine/S-adenosylhomocysteine deaminase
MLLRPYGILVSGKLELGLEVVRENGRILELRPHTGVPDSFVLSVPFVNAHSHLEYRGFLGKLDGLDYWSWIRELTRLKSFQSDEDVMRDARLAAGENRSTGVGLIGEHSDRPFAGEALAENGIGGSIFQEVITFFEKESPEEKLASVHARAERNRAAFGGVVHLSPHALYTVDEGTLAGFGHSSQPISIHLAESKHERAFYENGKGPIGDFYRSAGVAFEPPGCSPTKIASSLGLLRVGAQLVHCCDCSSDDVELISKSGASVAHCPRSNENLGCPTAPIKDFLDAGVTVGLGLDSAASSGPVDMFDEMRAAMRAAESRGSPLRGDQVWMMATAGGAASLGRANWDLEPGFEGPLIALRISGAHLPEDLIVEGAPGAVAWIA